MEKLGSPIEGSAIELKKDWITKALIIKYHDQLILNSKYNHNKSHIDSNPNIINTCNQIQCPSSNLEFNNRCIIIDNRLISISKCSNKNKKATQMIKGVNGY